jgi:hypothetical protein
MGFRLVGQVDDLHLVRVGRHVGVEHLEQGSCRAGAGRALRGARCRKPHVRTRHGLCGRVARPLAGLPEVGHGLGCLQRVFRQATPVAASMRSSSSMRPRLSKPRSRSSELDRTSAHSAASLQEGERDRLALSGLCMRLSPLVAGADCARGAREAPGSSGCVVIMVQLSPLRYRTVACAAGESRKRLAPASMRLAL